MDWEEDPFGRANDFENQRAPFLPIPPASQPFSAPAWETFETDSLDSLEAKFTRRLDYLLPIDTDTGVTTHEAVCIYLDAMIEMVSRHHQPLSVLSIAVDDSVVLRFLGTEGAALIGRAVARCLRQETRTHDVVGHADPALSPDGFSFLVTCPLLTEEQASNLGERLRAAMTAHSGEPERPWLTLSVGVASMSLDVTDAGLLVARSMDALRRARRAGGSRVWRHTDTLRAIMEQSDGMPDEHGAAKFLLDEPGVEEQGFRKHGFEEPLFGDGEREDTDA